MSIGKLYTQADDDTFAELLDVCSFEDITYDQSKQKNRMPGYVTQDCSAEITASFAGKSCEIGRRFGLIIDVWIKRQKQIEERRLRLLKPKSVRGIKKNTQIGGIEK